MNIFALLPFLFITSCSPKGHATLSITVTNIQSDQGNIGVALFNDENKFLKKHGGFTGKFVEIKAPGELIIAIDDLPEGVYAVSLFHDVNGNGELDQNLLGIPTEPYGFSNNAKAMVGPPSYQKAAFKVYGKKVDIQIQLN